MTTIDNEVKVAESSRKAKEEYAKIAKRLGIFNRSKALNDKRYGIKISCLSSIPVQYEGIITSDKGKTLFIVQETNLNRFRIKIDQACDKALYR